MRSRFRDQAVGNRWDSRRWIARDRRLQSRPMSDAPTTDPKSPAERNGLVPLLVVGAVLVAVYFGWQTLGRRPRSEPFGPWSDAHQVAPDPPALAPATGQGGPSVAVEDEDEPEE